jgi:hypothetical protein
MSHYGVLGNYRFQEAADDIRGTHLYGLQDQKLGKIEDVIFDHTTGNVLYVVVDTGGWLSTKEFIVPADRLQASTEHKGDFSSDLTKKQIETFPPYNKSDLQSDEKWADYEGRYRSKWETGPVVHRAETDRNVTPTTQQLQGNPVSSGTPAGAPSATSSGCGAPGQYLNGTGSASRHGLGNNRKQRRRNWWPLGHVSNAPTRTSQGSSGRLPDMLGRACRSKGLGERRHLEEGGLGFTRFRGWPFELPESPGATLDSRSTSAAPRRPF